VKTVCCCYQLLPRLGYEHWQKNLLTQQLPMKTIHPKQLLELAFRLYVFVFLNVYGLGKLLGGQFYTPESIPEEVASIPLGVASNFDLAWTFMGRSYGYILFIGISQLLGAWMLLFPRTKLLGGGDFASDSGKYYCIRYLLPGRLRGSCECRDLFFHVDGSVGIQLGKSSGRFSYTDHKDSIKGGDLECRTGDFTLCGHLLVGSAACSLVGAWKGVGTKDSLPVGK
jgi:hypothetical protein